ncbi:MAG: hypothetical protein NWT00_02330 [Beijerinckiaceae bacterium]|nr:hypothetical protein [Beijerinckiaceae bacterium]
MAVDPVQEPEGQFEGHIKNPQAAAEARALVKAFLLYGGLAFGAGFVFGLLRELAFVRLAGRQAAHWIEFPLMLAAIGLIALYCVKRLHNRQTKYLLFLGIAGTIVLLAIESGFTLYVMRVSLYQYLASFNIANGALFPFGLFFMSIAPLAVQRFWMERP